MMIQNPYNKIYRLSDLRGILQKLSDLIDSMGINPDDLSFQFEKSTIYQQIFLLQSYESDEFGSRFIVSHPAFEAAIEGYPETEELVRKHNNLTIESANAMFGDDYFIEGLNNFRQHKEMERRFIRANIGSFLGFILDNSAVLLAGVIKDKLKIQIKSFNSNKDRIGFLYDYQADLKHKKKSMHKNLNNALTEFIEIEIETCLKKESLFNNSITLIEISRIVKNLKSEVDSNAICQSLINSLKNELFEQVKENLYELLKRPSYWDFTKNEPEKYFHIFMFGLLQFLDCRYEVKSNKESGYGRYDIMLIPINKDECGVIFELKKADNKESKFNEKEYTNALEQIDSKEYFTELKSKGIKKVLNVAVIFKENKPNIDYDVKNIN